MVHIDQAQAWLQARFLERPWQGTTTSAAQEGPAVVPAEAFHEFLLSIGAPVATTVKECRRLGWMLKRLSESSIAGGHLTAVYWVFDSVMATRPETGPESPTPEPAPASPVDDTSMIAASEVCELYHEHFPSLKKLRGFLQKHPTIRTDKPRPQRRNVHLGDLTQAMIREGLVGTDSLEHVPPSQVDALVSIAQRKAAIDADRGPTAGGK